MQHCRVVSATKAVANLRETVVGEFFRQRHRYLAGPGDRPAAALGHQVSHFSFVVFSDRSFNVVETDLPVLQSQQVF